MKLKSIVVMVMVVIMSGLIVSTGAGKAAYR